MVYFWGSFFCLVDIILHLWTVFCVFVNVICIKKLHYQIKDKTVAFFPHSPPTHTQPEIFPPPSTPPQTQFPSQIETIISSNFLTFLVQKSKNQIVLNYRLYLRKFDLLPNFCVLSAPIYRNIFKGFILFVILKTHFIIVTKSKKVSFIIVIIWWKFYIVGKKSEKCLVL